jgi:hypothetical protein
MDLPDLLTNQPPTAQFRELLPKGCRSDRYR